MINRLVILLLVVPVAIILIALAVANRAPASFTLDPFNPGNPALTVTLPLFVLLFAALILGLVIGGFAAWLKQGYYRRLARERGHEVQRLRETAPRQPAAPALPGPRA
jgi:uncharacterized integral membrane protein